MTWCLNNNNNIYTLLYIKYITNKDLLYTENYTQYFVITYKGKELEKSEKEYIYIYTYIQESLYCTPETNVIL